MPNLACNHALELICLLQTRIPGKWERKLVGGRTDSGAPGLARPGGEGVAGREGDLRYAE